MVGNPGPEHDTVLARTVFRSVVRRALDEGVVGSASGPEGTVDGGLRRSVLTEGVLAGVRPAAVPRLFARGYHDRAASFRGRERRAFHATMAPVVRWLEDQTTRLIWPEVERQGPPEEAGWVREMTARQLARRGRERLRVPVRLPWLLAALDPGSETRAISHLPGPDAASRIDRLLAKPEHRFAIVRRLAAEGGGPRVLRSLCASPAFFEEDELCRRLLSDGDSGQISCALFALCLNPGMAPGVAGRLAEALAERPFPDVAERCVEVYAQAALSPAVPEDVSQALLELVAVALEEGEAGPGGEVLLDAVRRDGRLFRHVFLAADAADALTGAPEVAAALRRHVWELFATTFSPAGVTHPLHDEAFAACVGRAVASRAGEAPDSVADLLAVGQALPELAAHLRPEAPASLETLFHAAFARAVLAGARQAWAGEPGGEVALRLYGTVARLAAGPAHRLLGSGLLGVLEHRVEPGRLERIVPGMLAEVGRLEAREALPPVRRQRTDPNLRAVPPSKPEVPAAAETPAPAEAPAAAEPAAPPAPSEPKEYVVPAASPGTALLRVLLLPLRSLGMGLEGQLRIEDDRLRFSESARLGTAMLRERHAEVALSEVGEVATRPSPAQVYRLVGLGILLSFASAGMVLFFYGLRASHLGLSLLGAGVGLLGLLLDGGCHRAWLEGQGSSVVTIRRSDGETALCCRVDGEAATRLLERLEADGES